ncbi:MAG: Vms1/Ankzf1 family peptidyl-tRNA hydrolase [Gemmatimonadota bacterium]
MISKQDLERILALETNGRKIFSLFLDLSVNSDNKRTHQIFLNQRRAQFDELDSERWNHPHEEIGRAFKRVDEWLDDEFSEENKGVVIYAELGGDYFEALQFPVTVQNRLVISDKPAVGPLAQVLESYHHHGVVLLDRERVRILSVYLGTLLDEIEVHGEPYPTAHDVQAGGYSQMRYQRRKLEEMRHFFREFAKEVEEFVHQYRPHDLLILGTDENVGKFRDFLPEAVQEKIVFTGPMRVDETTSEILNRIEPHLEAERGRESQELLQLVRERVRQDYLATAGFQSTLQALQEGKVDTLVIAQDQEREGARCTQCGFVFAKNAEKCPYDGSPMEGGVDVVEEVIRLAESHGSEIEFVPASEAGDFAGVAALLRF